jgi:Ca-activated chloride channel family protein
MLVIVRQRSARHSPEPIRPFTRWPAPVKALPILLAVTLALFAPLHAQANPRIDLRIVSPMAGMPVFGDVPILAEVTPPHGTKILKVEFFVDGRMIGTVLDPPYRLDWDAQEGADHHVFKVKAYASNGSFAFAESRTPPRLGIQRARVLLVEVYVTVKDRIGRFTTNLESEHFTIEEDGVKQRLALFSPERKPVQVVLLLDVSASMKREKRLSTAIKAAQIFVEALEPEDSVAVVTFSDKVSVLEEFGSDRIRTMGAIGSVVPQRGTALYDAIHASAQMLGDKEGRRALVLLSDGQDLAYDGMNSGSLHTFEDALSEVLRQQVTVYTIGLGEQLATDFDFNRLHSAKDVLTRLGTDTGGRFFPVRRPGRLKRAFNNVLEELRFQYTLGYSPGNERHDGTWRQIAVEVNKPGLNVTARKGYFAPED